MQYKEIIEAVNMFDKASAGDLRSRANLVEAMTTSDFPQLLGQGYNARLGGEYTALEPAWNKYSTKVTVPNFLEQKIKGILPDANGLALVPEGTEYPHGAFGDISSSFRVEKYGRIFQLTYEMIKNDQLGAFTRLPSLLANTARALESQVTARALLKNDLSDVNTDFFTSANGNGVESVALSRQAVKDAVTKIAGRKHTAFGVQLPKLVLLVPPALGEEARDIVNAVRVRTTQGKDVIESNNTLSDTVTVVVEPALQLSTHAKANTTWFILPAPDSPLPAVLTGFLAGEENPDLRYKNDQGVRIGGGSISPTEGSFLDDTISYRARHIVGATTAYPQFTFVGRG